jgi:hypothetical protein
MIRSTITLKITGHALLNKQLINYGNRDCLAPFPMHQLINTMSATINNNTVSMNTKDLLPAMLRMLDNRELAHYNGTTPTKYDEYLNYGDMIGATNSSFNGFTQSSNDPFMRSRGSFPLDRVSATTPADAPLVVSTGAADDLVAYVTFTVEEPLLLSPFLFGNPQSNNQGFYGIQNMSFNLTLGSANRVWRHYGDIATGSTITDVTIHEVKDSKLLFQFLSCHPSQQLSSRCVVPYYELSRYINSQSVIIDARANSGVLGVRPTPGKATYSSSTISFNQIPDKLIIFLRKPTQTSSDSDSFLPITKININWNNSSGVCSSFSQAELWKKSVEAGSNQTWDEFRGYVYKQGNATTETTAGTGAGSYIATCGSVLILNMAQHVNLIEDFYSPGSIGNFTFQIRVDCENWGAAYAPELVVCTMNSGSFATERGTSSTYTALLTKEDVLNASQQEPTAHSDVKRMVGGGFLDSLKSVFKWVANPNNRKQIGSIVRSGMDAHDAYTGKSGNDRGRKIVGALGGAMGGARSGGGLMARLK